MSKAALKKALAEMSKEEIIEVVAELYDARSEAKSYFEYWLKPNPDAVFEETKEMVNKLFFYSTGRNRKEPTATQLKKIIKDFSSMTYDAEKIAGLYVHIAAQHYNWLVQKKSAFLSSEAAVRRDYENALKYVESADLESVYGHKLNQIKEYTDKFFNHLPEPTRRGRRRRWW